MAGEGPQWLEAQMNAGGPTGSTAPGGPAGSTLPNPAGATPPAAGVPPAQAAAAPVDPYTQLINSILQQQMMQSLSPYLNPTGSLPGYGSSFTPGQTTAPQNAPGATQQPPQGGLPTPTAFLPGAPGTTGNAAVAPNGGFTPGGQSPIDTSQYFMPPSQAGASYNQGTAGSAQGWQQFLGMMNQSLPNPNQGSNQLIGA